MSGLPKDPNLKGVIPNTFDHIFLKISGSQTTEEKTSYMVSAQFLEIYQEECRDLLGADPTKKLQMKESKETGVYVAVNIYFSYCLFYIKLNF